MKKFLFRVVIACIIGAIIYTYVKHEIVDPIKQEIDVQFDQLDKLFQVP